MPLARVTIANWSGRMRHCVSRTNRFGLLRCAGAVLGRLAFWCGIRSRVTIDNLARAYPEWSSAKRRFHVAARCYSSLGDGLLEFLFLRYATKAAIERGLEITNLVEFFPSYSRSERSDLAFRSRRELEWLALGCGLRIEMPLDVIIKKPAVGRCRAFPHSRCESRFGNRMLDAGNSSRDVSRPSEPQNCWLCAWRSSCICGRRSCSILRHRSSHARRNSAPCACHARAHSFSSTL